VTAGGVTTYQLTDLAELAVRLGSIVSFDRRGEVMYLTSFERDGSPHELAITAGGTIDTGTALARSGQFALRLKHDGGLGAGITATWIVAYTVLGRFGVEVSVDMDASLSRFDLKLLGYDGVDRREFGIRYNAITDELSVLTSAGTYALLASGLGYASATAGLVTFKIVGDFTNDTYTRILANERAFTPSQSAFHTASAVRPPYIGVSAGIVGNGGAVAGFASVDDLIITQNEPA
jgi:hypothetical protein